MRRVSSAVLAAALLSSFAYAAPGLAHAAQPTGVFTSADSAAIDKLIHDYFHAFTVKNYAAFADYFAAPFLLVGPEPRVLPTVPDAVRMWRHIREPLDHTDYATSQPVHIRVLAISPQTALANIYWQRLTRSGAVMSQGAEYYFMTKKSGHWQIDGNMGQQLALYQGAR